MTEEALAQMVVDPTLLTEAFMHTPWLLAAWLGYQLARKVLADLCQTVPEVLGIGKSLVATLDTAVNKGVKVRVVLDDGRDEDEDRPR